MRVKMNWYIPTGVTGIGPESVFQALPEKARSFPHDIGSKFIWGFKEDRVYLSVTVPSIQATTTVCLMVEAFLLSHDVPLDGVLVYPDGGSMPDIDATQVVSFARSRHDGIRKAITALRATKFTVANRELRKIRKDLERTLADLKI